MAGIAAPNLSRTKLQTSRASPSKAICSFIGPCSARLALINSAHIRETSSTGVSSVASASSRTWLSSREGLQKRAPDLALRTAPANSNLSAIKPSSVLSTRSISKRTCSIVSGGLLMSCPICNWLACETWSQNQFLSVPFRLGIKTLNCFNKDEPGKTGPYRFSKPFATMDKARFCKTP